MKVAFIIIDMQKGCLEDTKHKDIFNRAVDYINETSAMFREAYQPVIVIQDVEVGNGPGSEGFELVDELMVCGSDSTLYKQYCNAFWETELDNILREMNVGFVVVSGFAAEHCVLFTYNGAVERNYQAALLQNGIAGFDEVAVKETLLLRPVVSYQALSYFLNPQND